MQTKGVNMYWNKTNFAIAYAIALCVALFFLIGCTSDVGKLTRDNTLVNCGIDIKVKQ